MKKILSEISLSCEIIERFRNVSKHEINWYEETVQEETVGTTEGKRTVYYTTKYERSSKNRRYTE